MTSTLRLSTTIINMALNKRPLKPDDYIKGSRFKTIVKFLRAVDARTEAYRERLVPELEAYFCETSFVDRYWLEELR